jgi:hypothetical protein
MADKASWTKPSRAVPYGDSIGGGILARGRASGKSGAQGTLKGWRPRSRGHADSGQPGNDRESGAARARGQGLDERAVCDPPGRGVGGADPMPGIVSEGVQGGRRGPEEQRVEQPAGSPTSACSARGAGETT